MPSFMKIFLVGAEFLLADERTDIRKQLVDAPASSSLTPFTSYLNLLHTLRLYFLKIHFNIILPSNLRVFV